MSGNGRMALPDVREYSGGPHGCPEVVERLSRMSGSGQEALSDVLEWSGALRMSGSDQVALPDVRVTIPDVREWSGVRRGCPGVVGQPSRMSRSVPETFPDVRKW